MSVKTHFGFQEIPIEEKTSKVRDLFHDVAPHYDLMNDLMSFGIHRLWKSDLVRSLCIPRQGFVLDLAGGTGDIAHHLQKTFPHLDLRVFVCDLTKDMIQQGRDRLINKGVHSIHWINGNGEFLPFPDNSFDACTISFGMRNITNMDQTLREIYRVLKPKGQFISLEFSHIQNAPLLQSLYHFYSFKVIPKMGKWVANQPEAYKYLVECIKRFPSQEKYAYSIQEAGFANVRWTNLLEGICAIHKAHKETH